MPPNIVDDESSASTVAVREGLNISLTCKAKGNPEPKIIWRRENALKITVDRRKKGEKIIIVYYVYDKIIVSTRNKCIIVLNENYWLVGNTTKYFTLSKLVIEKEV